LSHPYALITHGYGFLIAVYQHLHAKSFGFGFHLTQGCKGAQLLSGVYGIGYQLPEENFVVGVQKLLDDGEDVLGLNMDGSLLHSVGFFEFGWWGLNLYAIGMVTAKLSGHKKSRQP
jgi:hypothetical protein